MQEPRSLLILLVLIVVAAALSSPFGTPEIAAFAKDFLPAAATLVSAYVGAWYGAALVKQSAKDDERKRNIGAGVRAMFTLWRQVNVVAQIQLDVVSKYRDNPAAPVVMPPVEYPLNDVARLNLDELAFLLDQGNSKVLEDLSIAEQRFVHAVETIRERSRLHLAEIQPVLERLIPKGGPIPHAELEAALGPRLFSLLIDKTRMLIYQVDDAVETLDSAASGLYMALKSMFPEVKFPAPSQANSDNG
ncbi:hypothetical protein I5Q65_20420 [Pseudomonas aeruginosa]|nr:hypothetical protein APB27_12590 [Pseudomonas aeruginosa]MBG5161883.1 hypothetical protein [Pseudomonas aeruginosa]MBH3771474.1 hypothetical protein [Pseudomonas aeruginosa]RTT26706.1 hypothetical protein DY956_30290 [Pseudomonas paraeruginosa]HEK1481301.1 hypothetical protein [Pseudomonas aeruginosa]